MKRKSLKQLKYLSLTFIFLTLVFVSSFIFVSCDKDSETKIKLYNTQTESIEKIDIESYLEGVVAGEINNDAPIEALKAQAVMARTFTYKFLESSTSKYEGADISTDITEAQAYAKDKINDKIKKAVKETSGQTVKYEGEYINAYFHSNSGGKTALLKDGFSLSSENLPYLKSVKTGETNSNSNNYSWSYTFSKDEILNALRNMGASVSNVSSFKKGEVSESGRCLTLIIGGKEISAANFTETNKDYIIAAEVEGKFRSIFQDNIMKGTKYENQMLSFLPQSMKKGKIFIIADIDFLYDSTWSDNSYKNKNTTYGFVPWSENGLLLERILHKINGNEELVALKIQSNLPQDSLGTKFKQEAEKNFLQEKEQKQQDLKASIAKAERMNFQNYSMGNMQQINRLQEEITTAEKAISQLDYQAEQAYKKKINIFMGASVGAMLLYAAIIALIFRRRLKHRRSYKEKSDE